MTASLSTVDTEATAVARGSGFAQRLEGEGDAVMITLVLPSLVAGRDLADDFVDQLGDLTDAEVVVDARELTSGTSSFAAQLVRRTLVDGRAKQVVVVGAPSTFVRHLHDAAAALGRTSALVTQDSLDFAAAS